MKKKLVTADTNTYDVIVVLGGSIGEDGSLPQFIELRIDEAIRISRNTFPIIMSGLWSYLLTYKPPLSTAAAMKKYAIKKFPDFSCDLIKLEEASMDVLGSAYYVKECFLDPRRWARVLLITSEFQIERAVYIFKKVLGNDYDIIPKAIPSGFTAQELTAKKFQEHRLYLFQKHFLDPVEHSNMQAIRNVMNLFPGYSASPVYNQADILAAMDIGMPVVDTYGLG